MSKGVRNYAGLEREARQDSSMRGLPVLGENKFGQIAFVKRGGTEALPHELPEAMPPQAHYVSRENDARRIATRHRLEAMQRCFAGQRV